MIQYEESGGVSVLRLDSPPLNTITFSLLDELRAAIIRANSDDRVRGIVITGGPAHFSAGADIGIFQEIASVDDALRASRVFQDAFQDVEDSPKPVAAAVAGNVLGGALELAMACHLRICGQDTRFRMPEVNLGINPGAGGTQRLPRLVGVEPALKMLLTAEAIDARRALVLGLVDAICEGRELLETAQALLQSASALPKTSQRTGKVNDSRVNDAAFDQANKLLQKVRPEIVAPRKIVEAVKVGLEQSFQTGLRKEQQVFAECIDTPATQNKMYLHFATRRTSKVPHLVGARPAKIANAAVIGMGTMGTGIAQALAMAAVPVMVRDQDPSALEKAVERIRGSIEKRIALGKLSEERAEEMLRLISTTAGWEEIAQADLVIESVFEDVSTKRSVIARLEGVCPTGTIIASNTSTISLDILAQRMQHSERLIGLHFFNPAHRMPLVEIIRREVTPENVIATALRFAKTLRKTPVVVNNREGFLVNRIFIPYLKEAFWLLEEGADPPAIDAAMVEFGFSMGPLALIDMAGLDILESSDRVLRRAFPRHGALSPIVARLVQRGQRGQKTGAGVYKYRKGSYAPFNSEQTARIVAEVRLEKKGTGPICRNGPKGASHKLDLSPFSAREITQRLVLRMVNEAFYVIEEGIARCESDLDVAMVLGTGFPDFRGGVLKYARGLGLETVLAQLEDLAGRCGERFSPCRLLSEMKGA